MFLLEIIKTINDSGLNFIYIDLNILKGGKLFMASILANILASLANVMNNGVSTFTYLGYYDETECPEEML